MRTLAEQISNECTHYNGLSRPGMREDSATRCCKAGVVYLTVKASEAVATGFARYPCFREGAAVPCGKRHFPTPEEVAAEVAERRARVERMSLGISAASDDAKARGYGKGKCGVGVVLCPVCKTGQLHYSVAGYNGHIHGRCTTPGCVSWMQ